MKRKRSLVRGLIVGAAVLALSIGLAVPAFAALNDDGAVIGTEAAPAQASITKLLKMPEGTTIPAATFTFKVTAVSKDGDESLKTSVPTITDKSVTYTSSTASAISGGIRTAPLETNNILTGVTWPGTGIYEYAITEQGATYTTLTGEEMTYSGGSYKLRVYVENGATAGTYYVKAVGAEINLVDNSGQTSGTKVDPTPGLDGKYGNMIFTNIFTKQDGGDPLESQAPFYISKTVAGDMADKAKYFTYDLKVEKPAIGAPAVFAFKAYVMEGPTVVTAAANYAGTIESDAHGAYISLGSSSNIQHEIKLKHGQKLVIANAYIGSTYTASERAAADYTPKVSIVANGAAAVVTNGTVNTALSTGSKIVGDAGNNTADYTNTYKTVTPTGVLINNLPFIMIFALAAGAFVAFVVVKSRKKAVATYTK